MIQNNSKKEGKRTSALKFPFPEVGQLPPSPRYGFSSLPLKICMFLQPPVSSTPCCALPLTDPFTLSGQTLVPSAWSGGPSGKLFSVPLSSLLCEALRPKIPN